MSACYHIFLRFSIQRYLLVCLTKIYVRSPLNVTNKIFPLFIWDTIKLGNGVNYSSEVPTNRTLHLSFFSTGTIGAAHSENTTCSVAGSEVAESTIISPTM